MAYVLCLMDMHVVSLTGHSLALQNKLAPQQVPDVVVPELLARGCVQCDVEGNVLVNGTPLAVRRMTLDVPQVSVGNDAEKRMETPMVISDEMKIDAAVAEAIAAKDQSLMDRRLGIPKVIAISEKVQFRVSKTQILASCKRLGYF
jgi:hypothetical protein